jgi:L-alanine-DL-glutamate epimerase-like enolase superfamily enzyme
MKIQKLETFCNEFVGFVRVTTDSGEQGWGQVSTYNTDITCDIFHRQIARHALGTDALNFADTLNLIGEREHKYPGSYLRRAMTGLDTALWDLRGKIEGKPVVSLIGGKPGKLRAYASSMKRDITPENEAKRFLKLRDEQGFTAFKWRVGAECGRDQDEWPGRTEKIVPYVSRALGDGIDKLVDGNSCYSPKCAIEVGRMLEQEGISHFEEPCPYWEFEQTKQVTEALSIDVTGGEQDCEIRTFKDMINHAANWSMVTLCTMHFLKALPNAGKYLEFSIEGADYYPWQYGLFRNDPYVIADGHVTITDEPGWGVEISPAWLERAKYQLSER